MPCNIQSRSHWWGGSLVRQLLIFVCPVTLGNIFLHNEKSPTYSIFDFRGEQCGSCQCPALPSPSSVPWRALILTKVGIATKRQWKFNKERCIWDGNALMAWAVLGSAEKSVWKKKKGKTTDSIFCLQFHHLNTYLKPSTNMQGNLRFGQIFGKCLVLFRPASRWGFASSYTSTVSAEQPPRNLPVALQH